MSSGGAQARTREKLAYSYDHIWSATVRLLRVDERFPIDERDPEIGFVLFEYRDMHKKVPGSIEIVRGQKGQQGIEVIVQIPAMPAYVERVLIQSLQRKLKREYGVPLARKPQKSVGRQASAAELKEEPINVANKQTDTKTGSKPRTSGKK